MKHIRMKLIGNKLFFIVVFILCIAKSNAQDNSGCLTKHQLIKMQSASLDDIRMFLNNEGWDFDGAKSDQSFNYFDYLINYNTVSWEKSSYYNGGNIILYNSSGKPNIVIYQSNSLCFNDLLKSFTFTKGKTSVYNDKLVTLFKENNITTEFIEHKNDYSSRKFTILVYNSIVLSKEVEQKKKYDNAISEGDLLFSSDKFKAAKLKYLIALEIENNVLVQSKVDLCDMEICKKLISKGDSLHNINQYEKALRVFTEAKSCSKSLLSLQEKIKITERKILDGKILTIKDKADLYFNDKKYDLALESYDSILLLDESNLYATEKIKSIERKRLDDKINTIQSKADLYFNDKKYDLALESYNSILQLDKSNVYASEKIKSIERKRLDDKINTIQSKADLYFNDKKYDLALESYNSILQLDKSNVYASEKIKSIERKRLDDKINPIQSKADLYFNDKKYDLALEGYNVILQLDKSNVYASEKIKITELKILNDKINTIQSKADLYFNDEKYDLALESYNAILQLDESSIYASDRINKILEIKSTLTKRSTTVFSYKSTNKNDLIQFQNLLLDDMKLQIKKNKKGFVNLNILISFDTLGNNLSAVKNISSSITGYTKKLSNITSSSILKPSSENGYFLASQENLKLDVKWSTTKNLFKSNLKGIFQNEYPIPSYTAVASFINKQPFKNGKYIFEGKDKEVNGKSYSDINLVKYRAVGPEAAFLSMLMPGMGTLKVTYGNKGWGRFKCFLFSSGLAIGSKLYSDAQYKSYLGATSQADIDNYYNNANISYKIALISGGISATIYLYDIIWVISKGAKNIKDSKPLRKQLQQGPVQIQNQSISWQ